MCILFLPNMPNENVKLVAVGKVYSKAITALENLDIEVIKLAGNNFNDTPISYHADMLFTHIGGKDIITFDGENKSLFEKYGFNVILGDVPRFPYPNDALYNVLFIKDMLFLNPKSASNFFFSINKKIIFVKQGYTKCSSTVVSDNSLITSDMSIYNAMKSCKIDVLFVSSQEIKLDGYNHGFIGGCCGLIAKDKLAFCGDITSHSQYKEIANFCYQSRVEVVSLYKGQLEDIGSIIPLK